MGQKLLLADGHLLADSVPLRYAWAGLGAKSIMHTALLRDHTVQLLGLNGKDGAIRECVSCGSRQGRTYLPLGIRAGGEELAQRTSGIQRAQL